MRYNKALVRMTAVFTALLWTGTAFAHAPTIVIEMTSEGFVPREVTVDTATTINFVNKDSVDRWPASNVHPTHDIYPDFDSQHAVPPGDLWIFRPQQAGQFKYHDHLFPHRRGTLTVLAEENETVTPPAPPSLVRRISNRTYTIFAHLRERFRDLFRSRQSSPNAVSATVALDATAFIALAEAEQYDYLATFSQQQGLVATWKYVRDAYTNSTGATVGGRAHDVAHFVGALIFKNQGLGGLSVCEATFAFGCYHGFTEAAFEHNLDHLPPIARACESLGAISSGPWASCIHGIGHGVATFFDAVDLASALSACDNLQSGATYCHDGVFMEFSFSAPPSFFTADDPLAPCTNIGPQYQPACARNQPHVMQQRFSLSKTAIADACATAPATISDPCIDALGFAIAHESNGQATLIASECQKFGARTLQTKCISAAAGELVFQNFPNWRTAAPAVCQSLAPEDQNRCHQRVQTTAKNYNRN